ncbi:7TM chemoreceptor [Ostertagia ostertagi]
MKEKQSGASWRPGTAGHVKGRRDPGHRSTGTGKPVGAPERRTLTDGQGGAGIGLLPVGLRKQSPFRNRQIRANTHAGFEGSNPVGRSRKNHFNQNFQNILSACRTQRPSILAQVPPVASYTVVVECICCLAFAANILLLVVFIVSSSKTLTCKYFLILSITQNLVSSVTFFFMAPKAISFDRTFLLVSTGRGGEWMIGPFVLLLYSMTFVSSIIFVTNSFVYKYFQLCRPWSSTIYTSTKWLLLIGLVNFAIVVNWILMNIFCGWPSIEFVRFVRDSVVKSHNFDVINATFMGISFNHGLTAKTTVLLVEALVLIVVVGCVGLICAVRIHLFLARLTTGIHIRQSHQQLLTLLLLQTACPVFLLHTPLYTMYVLLFTGARSPHGLSIIIGILMALFPLISPLSVLVFVKDYREFIFCKLCSIQWKKSEAPLTRRASVCGADESDLLTIRKVSSNL